MITGGICEEQATFTDGVQRTLNTGIVTLLNYGRRVPTGVTTITFAHEAGHNFGSEVSGLVCGYVTHSRTFEWESC